MKPILFIALILLSWSVSVFCGPFNEKSNSKQSNREVNPIIVKKSKSIKYALLIGSGSTQNKNSPTFYMNILYVHQTLKKLGYKDKNIKILDNADKLKSILVEGDATKKNVLNELKKLSKRINTNGSLFIFRSGHGIIDLVFKNHEIQLKNETVSKRINKRVIGTEAVMVFPDGHLSFLEFQNKLSKISGKQIVVVLNQCFGGQFKNIAKMLDNILIVSETDEIEIAFNINKKGTEGSIWPFVKCICDGFC